MKLATTLVWIMAGLAVLNAAQRVARSAEADMLTVVGTGAILYLGYACVKEKNQWKTTSALPKKIKTLSTN